MDDSGRVRAGQSRGHLHGDIEQSPERNRSGFDHGSKGLPDHELGRDIGDALVAADVVDAEDVWMVQRRGCARFLLEPGEATDVAGDLGGQNL